MCLFQVLSCLNGLSSLRNLAFSDFMYKTSPICFCTNYRQYIIFALPHLHSLDNHVIHTEEKKLTNVFIFFYFSTLNNVM